MDDSRKILKSLEKISDQLEEIIFNTTPVNMTSVNVKTNGNLPREKRDTEKEEE